MMHELSKFCFIFWEGKGMVLKLDRVLNEEHFYGKIIQKTCTKS